MTKIYINPHNGHTRLIVAVNTQTKLKTTPHSDKILD